MKIKYNEKENSIEIKDGQKTQYYTIGFLMLINIFNAVVNLLNMNSKQLDWMGYIWVITGGLSLVILAYYLFKKTTLDKIPLEKIRRLKEKNILGVKRFSLELTNGKLRDLTQLKAQSDIAELKKMFADRGIKTC